MLKIENRT